MGLKIFGHSDDNVELRGIVDEEVGCWGEDVVVTVGRPEALFGENAAGVRVRMRYSPRNEGLWVAEVGQLDEGCPIPWPVSIGFDEVRGEPGYSVAVNIDCPDGTPVKWEVV